MDFLNRMNEVVDYIEDHLTEDFNLGDVAHLVNCNAYQFGRIFAFVTGTTITEYVRNRRLSLAALELKATQARVIDTALKYGYNSPESFTRAFRELHGLAPSQVYNTSAAVQMYPRLSFQLTIKGAEHMHYKIVEMPEITGLGVTKNFGQWTVTKEEESWKDRMGERWTYWNHFLDEGANLLLRDKYALYRAPFWQMGVMHTAENGDVIESIGAEALGDPSQYPDLQAFTIPACTWAVFEAKGTLNQADHPIDQLIPKVLTEWLPSSGYQKAMSYEIQVYGPGNTQSEDYVCEFWLPIKAK